MDPDEFQKICSSYSAIFFPSASKDEIHAMMAEYIESRIRGTSFIQLKKILQTENISGICRGVDSGAHSGKRSGLSEKQKMKLKMWRKKKLKNTRNVELV